MDGQRLNTYFLSLAVPFYIVALRGSFFDQTVIISEIS